jgi:hypothetical protein
MRHPSQRRAVRGGCIAPLVVRAPRAARLPADRLKSASRRLARPPSLAWCHAQRMLAQPCVVKSKVEISRPCGRATAVRRIYGEGFADVRAGATNSLDRCRPAFLEASSFLRPGCWRPSPARRLHRASCKRAAPARLAPVPPEGPREPRAAARTAPLARDPPLQAHRAAGPWAPPARSRRRARRRARRRPVR